MKFYIPNTETQISERNCKIIQNSGPLKKKKKKPLKKDLFHFYHLVNIDNSKMDSIGIFFH